MEEILTLIEVERQIKEMNDAIEDTPRALRDAAFEKHVEKCRQTEADLRERYRKQQQLFGAASELLEACQWAKDVFLKLADEGRYPEFMMVENGGQGMMPLVNAINKATA